MSDSTEQHGWTAVPRSLEKLIGSRKDARPTPLSVEDIPLPDSALVQEVTKYAKEHLPSETFNHSMRVYYYGMPLLHLQAQCRVLTLNRTSYREAAFPGLAL